MQKARSWVEVDTKALENNFRVLQKLSRGVGVMPVVKSNAYGHGMVPCAKLFEKLGARWLAVDDLDEALALRKAKIKANILVFGYTIPSRYIEAAKNNISITISSLEQLKKIAGIRLKGAGKLKIHLKIDTGLHRQGILPDEIDSALRILLAASSQKLEAIYSHFAAAENPENKKHVEFCKKQIREFKAVLEKIRTAGFAPMAHMSGSAATFLLKDAHFDLVRAGISIYGLWPSPETQNGVKHSHILKNVRMSLQPALSWKTVVSEVKSVKKGEGIGYDLTARVVRDSKIAIVPVGYWHGIFWAHSNRGAMLVRGKRAPILGRVSMDMTILDVTNILGVKESDEVVIIGSQGKEKISAEEFGADSGSFNYEAVTRINPLILRNFV